MPLKTCSQVRWPIRKKTAADIPDAGYETTFIEPPETPAHQFAVKAFTKAIFGTPAPVDANNTAKKLQKKQQTMDASQGKAPELAAPKENGLTLSPSKQPGGILRTPMTANKAQKSVTFGAHVVDNEGKRGNTGKSGIPNDCPGKFPSPWTPGTELKSEAESDRKPRTKLTTALLEARTTPQPKPGQKAKARDDSDITLDLGAPRSESGRYWKEQYESFAEKSAKEVKKLVAKQQMAKNYAKKKDGEATELAQKLEQERKRYRRRETELEQQNKELQERLRKAMAENLSTSVEVAALKSRISTLEQSIVAPSSEALENKPSFHIYEDSNKNLSNATPNEAGPEMSYLSQRSRVPPVGKENSPPKPRHIRRQTLPSTSSQLPATRSTASKFGVETGQVSTLLAKSPRTSTRGLESPYKPDIALPSIEQPPKSPLNTRKPYSNTLNVLPKSPAAVVPPSSPLPVPSPGLEDPWMAGADESSFAPADKYALPISSAPSNARPVRPAHRLHRSSKSIAQTDSAWSVRKPEVTATNTGRTSGSDLSTNAKPGTLHDNKPAPVELGTASDALPAESSAFDVIVPSLTDAKREVKVSTQYADGSPHGKRDRAQISVDRKEEARRRLQERKQRKQLAK